MRLVVCLPLLAIWASTAAADPSADGSSLELKDVPIAIGVNSPFSWIKDKALRGDQGRGFGVSAYVGLARHHAVRANYASYPEDGPSLSIIGEVMGGESASYSGTIDDLGLAYVWYPRRLWSGPTFELGVLRRAKNTSTSDEIRGTTETDTIDYAARGMVGWSWRFGYFYVAVAIGVSAGRERGYEVNTPDSSEMKTRQTVDRTGVDTEGYLRLGFAFGK